MTASHADPAEARYENRVAAMLLLGVLALIVVAAGATALWGLAALSMIALAGTVAVFAILLAYAAGF